MDCMEICMVGDILTGSPTDLPWKTAPENPPHTAHLTLLLK